MIQQNLRIRVLLEAVMTIHKITNFQKTPAILLIKGENFVGPEVQDQRTHMPIKNFLTTMKTFL